MRRESWIKGLELKQQTVPHMERIAVLVCGLFALQTSFVIAVQL
jgi:hypothetical protein